MTFSPLLLVGYDGLSEFFLLANSRNSFHLLQLGTNNAFDVHSVCADALVYESSAVAAG